MGDCDFLRWRVEIREVGGEFVGAGGGCGASMLGSECRVGCVADGLRSNTEHELRVKVECTNTEASSDFSSITNLRNPRKKRAVEDRKKFCVGHDWMTN